MIICHLISSLVPTCWDCPGPLSTMIPSALISRRAALQHVLRLLCLNPKLLMTDRFWLVLEPCCCRLNEGRTDVQTDSKQIQSCMTALGVTDSCQYHPLSYQMLTPCNQVIGFHRCPERDPTRGEKSVCQVREHSFDEMRYRCYLQVLPPRRCPRG